MSRQILLLTVQSSLINAFRTAYIHASNFDSTSLEFMKIQRRVGLKFT